MDADFSHPPQQIPELVRFAEERDADLVIASRYLPESRISNWPLSRRIFSRLSNFLARRVLSVPVRDYTNGFRCYSRRATELIVATCGSRGSGFIALSEILVSIYYRGMRVVETPTHFVNRVRGQSSLNRREIANALHGLFKIYGLKRELSLHRSIDARATL
jgi:dolichol-phosphate mannosyltransferase